MITIKDIARETGLSTATVSNALSGKGRVSEAKRREIVETANRMGYDLSRVHTSPASRIIAVFVETLSVIFCTHISEGICRAAEKNGFQVKLYNLDLLHDSSFNPPREQVRKKLERIARQLDASTLGAIYVSQYPRDVTGVIPVVPFPVIYAYCYTNDGAPSVNTDDQQGAYIAVQELISEAYARARKLLEDNYAKLELLATTLLEKETMDGRDVEKLLGLENSEEAGVESEELEKNSPEEEKCQE